MDTGGKKGTAFLLVTIAVLTCSAQHTELSTEFGTHVICDGWNDCSHKHLIAGTECHIDCDSASSCRSSELTFSSHCDYSNLNCTNYHSCYGSDVHCAPGAFCQINSGYKSMKRASVDCPKDAYCQLNCQNYESCWLNDVRCDHNSRCHINCRGRDSCSGMTVYARTAKTLQVTCIDDSCDNLSVYCPTSSNKTLDTLGIPKVGRISHPRSATSCTFHLFGNASEAEKIDIYAVGGINEVDIQNHGESELRQPVAVHCGNGYSAHCNIDPITTQCSLRNHLCNANVEAILNISNVTAVSGPLGDQVIVAEDGVDLRDPTVSTINIHRHVTSTYNSVYSWTMKHKVLMTALSAWCVFCLLTCGVVCYYGKKRNTKDRMEEREKPFGVHSDDTLYEGHSILDDDQPDEGTDGADNIDVNVDEYDSGSASDLEIMNQNKPRNGKQKKGRL